MSKRDSQNKQHRLFRVERGGEVIFVAASSAAHAIRTVFPPQKPTATEVTETPTNDCEAIDDFEAQEGCRCALCEASRSGETVGGVFYQRLADAIGEELDKQFGQTGLEKELWDYAGWGEEWDDFVGAKNPVFAFASPKCFPSIARWAKDGNILECESAAALRKAIGNVSRVVLSVSAGRD